MTWYAKQAELVTDPSAKATAYLSIGNVAWAKLSNKEKTQDEERLKVADMGISALQKAADLAPRRADVQGLLASISNFRALAQSTAWAAAIDRAAAQTYDRTRRVLNEEAKKAQAGASGAATPTPPTTPETPAGAPAGSGG